MNTTTKVLISVAAFGIIAGVGYYFYRRASKKAAAAISSPAQADIKQTTLTGVKPIIDNAPKAVNPVKNQSR